MISNVLSMLLLLLLRKSCNLRADKVNPLHIDQVAERCVLCLAVLVLVWWHIVNTSGGEERVYLSSAWQVEETKGQFQPGNTGTVQLENTRNFQLGAPFNPQVVIGN